MVFIIKKLVFLHEIFCTGGKLFWTVTKQQFFYMIMSANSFYNYNVNLRELFLLLVKIV